MAFRGTYDHTLDAKNRLTIPARFRHDLSGRVVVARALERCVSIWDAPAYDAFVAATLSSVHPASEQARQLRRFFSAGSYDTELDSAGRLMLTPPLMQHAGLGREVKVLGNGDCLEVWNPETWAAYDEDLAGVVRQITEGLGGAG